MKNNDIIQSLDRGIAIMQYLANRKSAGVTEIAKAFDIDKSTASRIMATLVKRNMVYKNTDTQKYSLSIGPLLFSYNIDMDHAIIEIARPVLQKISDLTRETVHLCAMHNNQVFLLSQIKSFKNRYVKDPVLPGMTEPFHCSAAGKVMLANMDRNSVHILLKTYGLHKHTHNTITDIQQLFNELDKIREQNYALDMEELNDKMCCLAMPVYDEYGYAAYSIGLSGTREDFQNSNTMKKYITILHNASMELTNLYCQHRNKYGI